MYMEPLDDYLFNLSGMKPGDKFIGCTNCWFQYEVGTVGKGICPDCGERLSILTVTEEDINERN
jgi:hypothetical protein